MHAIYISIEILIAYYIPAIYNDLGFFTKECFLIILTLETSNSNFFKVIIQFNKLKWNSHAYKYYSYFVLVSSFQFTKFFPLQNENSFVFCCSCLLETNLFILVFLVLLNSLLEIENSSRFWHFITYFGNICKINMRI